MNKNKILNWLVYLTGAVCLYLFISVRSLPLYNILLKEKLVPGYWDNTKYGECYYFSNIRTFREKGLPEVITKFQFDTLQSNPEDADILLFGDSFFDIARGTQFPRLLAEKTRHKIHFVYEELPLTYLEKINYKGNKEKILLLGLVERYIPTKGNILNRSEYKEDTRSSVAKLMDVIINTVFYKRSEELYDVLLKRSYIIGDIHSCIATFKFNSFKYISELTPKYLADENDPWLFYYDQVNSESTSFYYDHKFQEIENITHNIKELSFQLKTKYNLTLVFMPLPAQYTVCHEIINNDPYNNFLPMLYESLEKQNIPYIRIFDDFMNSNERLYYGTDGHWNIRGMELAINLSAQYITSHYSNLTEKVQ